MKKVLYNIQIKIPNGKERIIKIYLNDKPYDITVIIAKVLNKHLFK